MNKVVMFSIASLTLASCAAQDPNGPNFAQGVWSGQSIFPSTSLLTSRQGPLIGRTIYTTSGYGPLVVHYELIDPATAAPQYVAASVQGRNEYAIIPVSALQVSATDISVHANDTAMANLPHMSTEDLEQRYPRTVVTTPTEPNLAQVPRFGLQPLPGALGTAGAGPLQLSQQANVVGMRVVDSFGQEVGTINAVATEPSTGEVRYAIVSGPSFGLGNYIAVPASSAHVNGSQVVLNGSLAAWMQSPRYQTSQLPTMFGPVRGNLN